MRQPFLTLASLVRKTFGKITSLVCFLDKLLLFVEKSKICITPLFFLLFFSFLSLSSHMPKSLRIFSALSFSSPTPSRASAYPSSPLPGPCSAMLLSPWGAPLSRFSGSCRATISSSIVSLACPSPSLAHGVVAS